MNKVTLLGLSMLFLFSVACGAGDDSSQGEGSEEGSMLEQVTFDASFEQKEQEGQFNLKLTNNGEEPMALTFSSGQQYEIVVTDPSSGEEVYRFSEGKMFTQALVEEELEAGDEMTWEESWDYTSEEAFVDAGEYEATVSLLPKSINDEEVADQTLVSPVDVTVPEQAEPESSESEEKAEEDEQSEENEEEVQNEPSEDEESSEGEQAQLPAGNREGNDFIRNLGVKGEQGVYRVTGETNLSAPLNFSVEDGHFMFVEETAINTTGEESWKSFDFTVRIDEENLPDYGVLTIVFSWEEEGEKQYHSVLLEDFNE